MLTKCGKCDKMEQRADMLTFIIFKEAITMFDKWYASVGKKIKGLAFGAFIMESIAAIITGIVLIANGRDTIISIGVLIMVAGPIAAYVVSLFIYAFGELVDKACAIERHTRDFEKKSDVGTKADNEIVYSPEISNSRDLIAKEVSSKEESNALYKKEVELNTQKREKTPEEKEIEAKIASLKKEYNGLGVFQFVRRKEIEEELNSLRNKLSKLQQ